LFDRAARGEKQHHSQKKRKREEGGNECAAAESGSVLCGQRKKNKYGAESDPYTESGEKPELAGGRQADIVS
jgi:hypothetical protein